MKVPHTRRQYRPLWTAALVAVLLTAGSLSAGEGFVSFRGGFALKLPDEWQRMDYRTVDYFLSQTADSPEDFEYEAVFAPHPKGKPFFEGEYVMLTVDTVGRLSREEVDSTAADIAASFELPLVKRSIDDLLRDAPVDTVVYDVNRKLVAVLTDIWEAGKVVTKSLLMVKFYDRGFANFYCYAPVEAYEAAAPRFHALVESFTTDLEAYRTEPVEVAEIHLDRPDWRNWLPYAAAALVVLVVLVVILRRRRVKA